MNFYEITDKDKELIKVALNTLQNNFDDGIYHHTVGAALSCPNGKIYSGVNCDGIHGSCAEYITIGMRYGNFGRRKKFRHNCCGSR